MPEDCSHPKDAEKETTMKDPKDKSKTLWQVTCGICGSWLRGGSR